MTAIIPAQQHSIQPAIDHYWQCVNAVLDNLKPSSARVYAQTYRTWQAYCHDSGYSPFGLQEMSVRTFLDSTGNKKITMQRQLTALRAFAGVAVDYLKALEMEGVYLPFSSEHMQLLHNALERMKLRLGDHDKRLLPARQGVALSPADADRLLRVFASSEAQDVRNRAIIGILLLAGLRRFEAAKLRWDDVDTERGTLSILGKGKSEPDLIPLLDSAARLLTNWRNVQAKIMRKGATANYVFTSFVKNGTCKPTPLSGNDVWRIFKRACAEVGIEALPHDARRTLITELLDTMPVHEVQKIARHARGDTTLRYAKAQDAQKLKDKMKLRYG